MSFGFARFRAPTFADVATETAISGFLIAQSLARTPYRSTPTRLRARCASCPA